MALETETSIYGIKTPGEPIPITLRLPNVFSGTIITAIVLNLPTMGPFFYNALLNHDQYLVMSFLMFIAIITQIGNLLADIALAVLDPRIRMS